MPMPFADTDVKTFEGAFHFNVSTAFALTQAALPHLLESGNGSVVNITSAMGRFRDPRRTSRTARPRPRSRT